MKHLRLAMATLAAAGVFTPIAQGQSGPQCTPGSFPYAYPGEGVQPKTGAPYSGIAKLTYEQKLADNAIHGEEWVHQARDSAGRTRREFISNCLLGKDGQVHAQISVTVVDPVAKTALSWQEGGPPPRIARLSHMGVARTQTQTLTAEEKAEMQEWRKTAEGQQPARSDYQTLRLGSKDFDNLSAEGMRTTQWVQPGVQGNLQWLETMQEMWTSKQLGITVMMVSDDPRRGRTTFELEQISTAEPDASLFAPPAGYRTEEIHREGEGQ